MTYKVFAQVYMEHSGGTKFYEMIGVENEDGHAILVKRFGAIKNRGTGRYGQTMVEFGPKQEMLAEFNKTFNAKKRGKSDGAYSVYDAVSFGFHKETTVGSRISSGSLEHIAVDHYGKASAGDEGFEKFVRLSEEGRVNQPDTPPPTNELEHKSDDPSWGCW